MKWTGEPAAPPSRSFVDARTQERRAVAALDLQRHGGSGLDLRQQLVELIDRLDLGDVALDHHREDYVAFLQKADRSRDLLDLQPALELQLLLLVLGQRRHDESQPIGFFRRFLVLAAAAAAIGLRRVLFLHFLDDDLDFLVRALAPDLHRGLRPRLDLRDDPRQVVRLLDHAAIEFQDDVARLHARLVGRAALDDLVDERALHARQTERFGLVLVDRPDRDADATAPDLAGIAQLFGHVHRDVDRDRERNALIAAGAREDHRVDADDLALHVEQRTARIARIDRDVRLQERHEVGAGDVALLGAEDTGCHRRLQPERLPDRDDPFADLHLVRIADAGARQILRLDLDQRRVGAAIRADHFRAELALVGQLHAHFVGIVDDMMIGDDVAVVADDEAGARPGDFDVTVALLSAR